MKYLLLFSFMIVSGFCYCQQIKGKVLDKDTKLPVNGAMVRVGCKIAFTNILGDFSIAASTTDSLKITCFTYKPFKLPVTNTMETLRIELEPAKIVLNEVTIRSNRERDFKKDSAANREFYAKQFNYKGPKVINAFVPSGGNGTSQLLSIDIVTLVRALTKKSTRAYKFNKLLLRDEKTDYVNQKFSHGLVARVTGLKGDTLSAFVVQYRPTYAFAHKATDYEMELYIKDCYQKFLKEGIKGGELFIRPGTE
ncbi:carboxypeptidase-like regulatory domain-containing protein [Mucilaginibacter flavidus]|uniref:carboxypeptidase-like regulatory domain-containing protein n=1 Tax=Mucilaginibacter flavidus TaxID=2949309 RepID=UPI0020936EE1|nr:carboxypeptidase-like regulatory domain-containing protein [Mucilaginibacter flavidus]MCO5947202.1 carboxypeptidase-like regulatory domain-containing protein [Mucilaginibacter flavidus]